MDSELANALAKRTPGYGLDSGDASAAMSPADAGIAGGVTSLAPAADDSNASSMRRDALDGSDDDGIANFSTRILVNRMRVCLSQPHRMFSTKHGWQ